MNTPTAPLVIFDSKNLLFHSMGAISLIGAIITGLLAADGATLQTQLAHALFAITALAVWALHLTRSALNYLKGAPMTLLARPGDLTAMFKDLSPKPGAGNPPPGETRSYREKIPYTAQMALLPLLLLTGLMVSHPSAFFGILGPSGLVTAGQLHAALADAALLFAAFHIYFTMLRPEALWFNPAFITGKADPEKYLAMRPWLKPVPEKEEKAGNEDVERIPTVEELLNEGNMAAREGNYEKAAALFAKALEHYPGYPQALFNLGACLKKTGDHARAKEALTEYLKQDAFGQASMRAREMLAEMETAKGGGIES